MYTQVFDPVGDSLDAAGHGAPTSVDAGEVTGLMCGVVAHLAESAGNLVVGLRQAGQQVSECRAAYESRDATASAAFQAIL